MDERDEAILRVVADAIKNERRNGTIRDVRLQVDSLPAPSVRNEVEAPVIHIHVDMEPVAAAMREATEKQIAMAQATLDALQAHTEAINQLVQGIAESPAPVFRPRITIQPATVEPQIQVQAPLPIKRTKRRFSITEADGTKTMVEEA
jgi:hypothetical protein